MEDDNFKMRRSFSWDKAFFTNEGFLDAGELSSMISGGGDDVNHELDKFAEIENVETKLFEKINSSKQKSTTTSNKTNPNIKLSSRKKNSQEKKLTESSGPRATAVTTKSSSLHASIPIKKQPTKLPTLSDNVKSSRRNVTSKTPPGISAKNKTHLVNTHLPKTSPASPVSPGSSGSSSSISKVKQRSKRASSVPRRSSVNNDKLSSQNGKKKDEQNHTSPSNVSLKHKPPPGSSYPTSPLGPSNSSESYRARLLDRFPKSVSNKTGSPNTAKSKKQVPQSKTVAVKTGSKTTQKKPTPKTSKNKSSGTKVLFISPEVLDLKGKLNALKMEISMQKKDRCRETKKVTAGSGKGDPK